jgi:hypothetical protein
MSKKTHDLSVKVSTYTDDMGQQRTRWQRIGSVLEGQYGPYILLDRHINLAGLPGEGPVTVSMFDNAGQRYQSGDPPGTVQTGSTGSYPGQNRGVDLDDEIPF